MLICSPGAPPCHLRAGAGAAGGDDRGLPRARARSHPRAPACSRPACRARSTPGCCCCATSGRSACARCCAARSATRATASRAAGDRGAIARGRELLREWRASAELWLPVPEAARGCATRCWPRPTSGSRGRGRARRARRASMRRARVVPRLRGRGDRRRRARAAHRRGPRRPTGRPSRSREVRLPRLDGVQDRAWGQGPVLLQQLALLDGFDLGPFLGADHIHTVVECAKLAFADREACYGDSAPVPLDRLLSRDYAAERRELIGPEASGELRPGGPEPRLPRHLRRAPPRAPGSASRRAATPATSTSPTAGATWSRRRRAAAGCRARRPSPGSASASAPGRRCSGCSRGCRTR